MSATKKKKVHDHKHIEGRDHNHIDGHNHDDYKNGLDAKDISNNLGKSIIEEKRNIIKHSNFTHLEGEIDISRLQQTKSIKKRRKFT